MRLFDEYGIDIGYVLIGVIIFSLLISILLIVNIVKQSKLKKKYNKFMSGANGESLEKEVLQRFDEIANIKEQVSNISNKIEQIDTTLLSTYQKIGIVKYDAFKEMGGKLSFALALLNNENDGFILNSMHSSREGCYTYVKEIIKGESFVILAEEEKIALDEALNSKNYMK